MSSPNSYNPSGAVRLIGTFVTLTGTYVDPATVTLVLSWPAQWGGIAPGTAQYTYASGSVQKAAVGSYYYDFSPLPVGTPGVWTQTWIGSAPNVAFVGQVNIYQEPVP